MAIIGTDLDRARSIILNNGVVGIPTETVYGLAGNALSEEAILKIYEVKNRPRFDPLIAHSNSLEKIKDLVIDLPTFWKLVSESLNISRPFPDSNRFCETLS